MFDKDQVRAIRNDIDAALAAVAKKYGVAIGCGNARFTATTIDFKLQVVSGAEAGSSPRDAALANALDMFKPLHPGVDFDATYDLGSKAGHGKIVGYNHKAIKMPFIVEAGGKRYKLSEEQLARMPKV